MCRPGRAVPGFPPWRRRRPRTSLARAPDATSGLTANRRAMTPPPSSSLALQRLYHWERTAPDQTVFTQPMGGGLLKEFTWKDMGDGPRRMAPFLQQQVFEPGARIAILSKNCAWWLMA